MAHQRHPRTQSGPERKAPRGCLAVFFSIFLIAGIQVFFWLSLAPTLRSLAARNWPQAPCTIVSSRVIEHPGDDGSTYEISIQYEYEFEGRAYTSSRYSFFDIASSGRSGKERVVARYPPGSRTTCYVDPQNPERAVLDPGLRPEAAFGLIGMPFVLVGAGGLFYLFVLGPRKQARREREAVTARRSARTDALAGLPKEPLAAGPQILKPTASRLGSLALRAAFAVVWNGVTVTAAVTAFGGGAPIFVRLFLIPFLLVGFGAILWTFHGILALSNPRVVLRVSEGAPPLGEPVALSWEVEGRAASLERFQVLLVGREEARYRRGTDTVTERDVFYEKTIVEAEDPNEIARGGKAELMVPSDSMHTFEAPNNKILWRLVVRGKIPRWPDISEEYALTVLPHRELTPRSSFVGEDAS